MKISLGFIVLLLLTSSVMAQTPESTCANDSLFLISPDVINLRLNGEGRSGIEISWADLDPTQATCFALDLPDTLDPEVTATGEFRGQIDRVFSYLCADSGSVAGTPSVEFSGALGGVIPRPLRVNWFSLGPISNGIFEGSFNLANNGGLLRLNDGDGGTWDTINDNLSPSWYQVNITALTEGSGGVFFAGISSGSVPEVNSQGLFRNSGSGWEVMGEDYFSSTMIINSVAVSPTDNNMIAVGTDRDGLWVSQDGGSTFINWTSNFDEDYEEPPLTYKISALHWSGNTLLVALPNFGVFRSTDNGLTFSRTNFEVKYDLDSPANVFVIPYVNNFTVDPSDPDHFLAALAFHGAWESIDGGVNWTDLYGDLNSPIENVPGAWVYSALDIIVDPFDPQVIVIGCEQRGIYRSADGGLTWVLVGEISQPSNAAVLNHFSFAQRSSVAGEMFLFEDNWGLLYSTDSGLNWTAYPDQPSMNRGINLIATRDGSDYILGSTFGGVYNIGDEIVLSETYTSGTSDELMDLNMGVNLSFGTGVMVPLDSFEFICQTFQGWAVWRSPSHDWKNFSLLGLYDKVNPEDCIEGYCGDTSYELMPNCFGAKKAACFNFDTADTIRFFDQEVYEGFSYYYAISSFDYGNTALSTPVSNTNVMVFSPRYEEDENSPYDGPGNSTKFNVNSTAANATVDEEIYVYPNPLRESVGLPGAEGETVIFTNLPPDSRVRIFTTAGDDVMNLGPDTQIGRNIRWGTRNRENERVSAGVYLYKVEMLNREAYWGRLVIIR